MNRPGLPADWDATVRAAERGERATLRVERTSRERHNVLVTPSVPPNVSPTVVLVAEVTGAISLGSGLHPAKLYVVDNTVAPIAWVEVTGDFQVKPLPGQTLAVGDVGVALLVGVSADGEPVYTLGSAGGGDAPDCGIQFMGRDELDCFEARVPAQGEGACANVTATSSNLRLAWDAGESKYLSSTTFTTAAGATTVVLDLSEAEPAVSLTAPGDVVVAGRFSKCVDGWRRYAFYSTDLCGEAPVLDCASCAGGAPRHFTFAFAGGTGDVAPLNSATWNIPYLGGFCLWRDTKTPGQSVTTNPAAVLDMGARTLTLYPTGTLGGESLTYTLDDATDCCGPLAATRTGTVGISGASPSTLTLNPVGPCVRTRCQTHVFYVDVKCGDCPLIPTVCCSDGGFPSSLCVTLRANGSCGLGTITEVHRDLPYRGLLDGKHTWYTARINPIDHWCGLSDGGFVTNEVAWVFVVWCDGTHMRYDLVLIVDAASNVGGTSPHYSAIAADMGLVGTYDFVGSNGVGGGRLIDTSSPACDDDAILADDGTALYGNWHANGTDYQPSGSSGGAQCFPSSGDISWKLTKGACGGDAPAEMMMMMAPGGAALPCCGDRDLWPPFRAAGGTTSPPQSSPA